jgi:hypothetical protein
MSFPPQYHFFTPEGIPTVIPFTHPGLAKVQAAGASTCVSYSVGDRGAPTLPDNVNDGKFGYIIVPDTSIRFRRQNMDSPTSTTPTPPIQGPNATTSSAPSPVRVGAVPQMLAVYHLTGPEWMSLDQHLYSLAMKDVERLSAYFKTLPDGGARAFQAARVASYERLVLANKELFGQAIQKDAWSYRTINNNEAWKTMLAGLRDQLLGHRATAGDFIILTAAQVLL